MREMSDEMVDVILVQQVNWRYPVLDPMDFPLVEEGFLPSSVDFKTTKKSWVFNPT